VGKWRVTTSITKAGYKSAEADTDVDIALELSSNNLYTQTISLHPSNRIYTVSGRWESDAGDGGSIKLINNLYVFALFVNDGRVALCYIKEIQSNLDLCSLPDMKICSPVGDLYSEADPPLTCYQYPSAGYVKLYVRTIGKNQVLALTHHAPSIEAAPLNFTRQ
jgi:hypothetical protein